MKISCYFSSEVLEADSSLKERSNHYSIIMRLQTHLFYLQKRVDYLEEIIFHSPPLPFQCCQMTDYLRSMLGSSTLKMGVRKKGMNLDIVATLLTRSVEGTANTQAMSNKTKHFKPKY